MSRFSRQYRCLVACFCALVRWSFRFIHPLAAVVGGGAAAGGGEGRLVCRWALENGEGRRVISCGTVFVW